MTNSIIPNSFIPGTKAKASEVNENFIALANAIEQNKSLASSGITDLSEELSEFKTTVNQQKADKTELFSEFTVTQEDTDLNNYKTRGTYIFSELHIPLNVPEESAGMLVVVGDPDSSLKQTWLSQNDTVEIFTRTYNNETWGDWHSVTGDKQLGNPGYVKLPGGVMLQWGVRVGAKITYPIAFTALPGVVFMKQGCGNTYSRSDMGFANQYKTGFDMATVGMMNDLNWFAIGY